MAIDQANLFLIFSLNGIFIGLLFDFFRILRKSFKTINIITYIEDILFWVLTGFSIIYCMYNFSGGSLRLFMFLGLGFGMALYMLLFSKIIIKTVVFLITTVKGFVIRIIKIIIAPLKFIYNIIDKMIFRPIYILGIKTNSFMTKKYKKMDLKLKKAKKT